MLFSLFLILCIFKYFLFLSFFRNISVLLLLLYLQIFSRGERLQQNRSKYNKKVNSKKSEIRNISICQFKISNCLPLFLLKYFYTVLFLLYCDCKRNHACLPNWFIGPKLQVFCPFNSRVFFIESASYIPYTEGFEKYLEVFHQIIRQKHHMVHSFLFL